MVALQKFEPTIVVEKLDGFKSSDLEDLCTATEKTLDDDATSFSIGFNWLKSPTIDRLESYWNGLVLVPERQIFVGRVDGTVASAAQLVKPAPSNQAQCFACSLREHFVAPWARGHGLARKLLNAVEDEAAKLNFKVLKLEVRSTQDAAISLYETNGYKKWGELDKYEMVGGKYVAGYFYYKDLV